MQTNGMVAFMEFDDKNQEFVLAPEDFSVLGLPQECGRWPMEELGDLIDQVSMAQSNIENLDEIQFPYGSSRHEMRNMAVKQQEILRGIRSVIAQNATLGAETLQKLLEE